MAVLGLRFCARAPHYCGLSCCGAQAPDAQAQQLWLTGLVAPRYVGSSQTRARTRVPCTGRQILNHCATREAPMKQKPYCNNFNKDFKNGPHWGFPGGAVVESPPANAGDTGSSPGLGRSHVPRSN